uniref:Uncharacterized protein n=1 Tax=Arundo donax TaxID=35708 RepID=A0A0A9EYF7_ARUDO
MYMEIFLRRLLRIISKYMLFLFPFCLPKLFQNFGPSIVLHIFMLL